MSQMTFADLCQLFLSLRHHGASLGSDDLDVLRLWEKEGRVPDKIAEWMLQLKTQCLLDHQPFPKKLSSINRRMRAVETNEG